MNQETPSAAVRAPTGIGVVGCGYVLDLYLSRLGDHPEIRVTGVTDRDQTRALTVGQHYSLPVYADYDELLADPSVGIVLNLTNPREHAALSRRALEVGKNVYSEKPLATTWAEAQELVVLAERHGVSIASAPSTVLGEAAQTMWREIRRGSIGRPLLAYAELDDGLVHRERLSGWRSATGAAWPAFDEFEVGCTLEHAGYYVSWLVAMFGSVKSVTAFASQQISDKLPGVELCPPDTADFSVGVLQFHSGMVARVTCGVVARHDHSLRITGSEGTCEVAEAWDFGSPVRLARWHRFRHRLDRRPWTRLVGLGYRRVRPARRVGFKADTPGGNRIDFLRGVAEMVDSLTDDRRSRLPADFCLHVTEIVLTLSEPGTMGCPRDLVSSCAPVDPMPWARK